MANPFKYAQGKRNRIVENQRKKIKKIYEEALEDVRREIRFIEHKKDTSSVLKVSYLRDIQKDIKSNLDIVNRSVEKEIKSNMDLMVKEVVKNNDMFINGLGFNVYTRDQRITRDVVNRIVTGKIYSNDFSLSKSIWGDSEKIMQELRNVVAKDIAQNKGVYEIAKDLERYVNPNARKDWNWSAMSPGSRRKIDYNAQRLARTMVQHSFEESFVAVTKNNPFVEAYQWITSGSDRVCPVCIDREEGDHYGLGSGIYPKDSLPLDHPNGMCTFDVVLSMSKEEIADAIADWYLGEGDKKLNRKIDKYVKELQKY